MKCSCLCHAPNSFHAGGGRCKAEPGTECVNGSIESKPQRTDEEAARDRDQVKRMLLGPGGMAAHAEAAREFLEREW